MNSVAFLAALAAFRRAMAIIVVGERQPKSSRVFCSGCRKELEYLASDVEEKDGLLFLPCPRRVCRRQVYLGTAELQAPITKKGKKRG